MIKIHSLLQQWSRGASPAACQLLSVIPQSILKKIGYGQLAGKKGWCTESFTWALRATAYDFSPYCGEKWAKALKVVVAVAPAVQNFRDAHKSPDVKKRSSVKKSASVKTLVPSAVSASIRAIPYIVECYLAYHDWKKDPMQGVVRAVSAGLTYAAATAVDRKWVDENELPGNLLIGFLLINSITSIVMGLLSLGLEHNKRLH